VSGKGTGRSSKIFEAGGGEVTKIKLWGLEGVG